MSCRAQPSRMLANPRVPTPSQATQRQTTDTSSWPRAASFLALLALLALAACRAAAPPVTTVNPEAPPPLTVAEALATRSQDKLRVRGAVVVNRNEARICDGLAESHPPQCAGGARLLDFGAADLSPDGAACRGVRWAESVEVIVTVEGSGLRYIGPPRPGSGRSGQSTDCASPP